MIPATPDIVGTDRLDVRQVDAIALLVERVTELDGVRPLSEAVNLALSQTSSRGVRHFYVNDPQDPDRLIAYAFLDTHDPQHPQLEVALDSAARRSDLGGAIVDAALRETHGRLDVWVHGRSPNLTEIATSRGLTETRKLLRMRRSLLSDLPLAPLPQGIVIRSFDRRRDSDAWLELNAAAFADLPDQGSWTELDLARRTLEDWFDPAGFLLATTVDGEIVGFHWTKIHSPKVDEGFNDPVGEVYVLGVDPRWQGRGLGRALTVLGMAHLKKRGLREVILYVDAANVGAIKTYERLGFVRYETDTLYSSAVPSRP